MAYSHLCAARALRVARRKSIASLSGRGFTFSTSTRLGLKESSSQTDEDFEKHKRDSLAKQRRGRGHWKPELASDSEEAVRADRMVGEGVDPKVLQEKTKMEAEERTKAGTSNKDGL